MSQRKVTAMTPELRERWERARQETSRELSDLHALGERMRAAATEDTLSGHLRRAIHRSPRDLAAIATAAGIGAAELNDFLSGEQTLPSDVLDRLAAAVDFPPAVLNAASDGGA